MEMQSDLPGSAGGAWTAETHKTFYDGNLNTGLGDFIVETLSPRDMMEFGSGVCSLANYIAERQPLDASYCIEPQIKTDVGHNLNLLNIDVLSQPVPQCLNRRFDLVISIEVAEHIPLEKHEAVFDFLVSRAGRWIVFSGARPGQGGVGHIAERPELDWRAEFLRRGCTFDHRMSALVRTRCNQKNINHRQNVQVFRAPDRNIGLLEVEERARPYLTDLLAIIEANGGGMTGGLFYVDINGARAGMPEHSLHWKRENLYDLTQSATNMLEVGFAAGHAALLLLLANPKARLTVVDPMQLPYAQPCFDYMDRMFPGRLSLHCGLSQDVLPGLAPQRFDFVHLDGGKDVSIATDLRDLRDLVTEDHVLAIDDTQNAKLEAVVSAWEKDGSLSSDAFRAMNTKATRARWTHRICRYAPAAEHVSAVIADLHRLYQTCVASSNYAATGKQGKIEGWNRAEALINAMRDVEDQGLDGAFVEIGVAAGHSSVIAALASSRQFPRDFYLYDTFAGFGKDLPDEVDLNDVSIKDYDLSKYTKEDCRKPVVERRMLEAGISPDRLMMLQGFAQDTTTRIQPDRISILRLDADLFEPTYVALTQLFDRIQPGGYLIVDDYGHWKGCKDAVDQFFQERGEAFDGTELDYTCYIKRLSPVPSSSHSSAKTTSPSDSTGSNVSKDSRPMPISSFLRWMRKRL